MTSPSDNLVPIIAQALKGYSVAFMLDCQAGKGDKAADEIASIIAERLSLAIPASNDLVGEMETLKALISEESIERLAEDIACAIVDCSNPKIVASRHSAMVRLGERLRKPNKRDIEAASRMRDARNGGGE